MTHNDNKHTTATTTTTTQSKTRTNSNDSSVDFVTFAKGTRIEIWWPEDERYYAGNIEGLRNNHNEQRRAWKIRYDDGESEWLDLRLERYRILSSHDNDDKNDDDIEPFKPRPLNDTSQVHVGTLVSVWWEYYSRYFPGVVKRIRPNRAKPFFVQYDDGDVRWEDLQCTKFFIRRKVQEQYDEL